MNDVTQGDHKEGEQITKYESIVAVLGRLRREVAPITVFVPGTEEEGKTHILEVDADAGFFSMDRLMPHTVQIAFGQAGQLQVTAFLRSGARAMFFATLSHFIEDAKGAAIVCPIPDIIYYHQLREYFRVPLPEDMKGTIQLFEAGNTPIAEGEFFDLSIGGIGALVKSEKEIITGAHFPRCKLTLPPILPALQTGLDIRRATPIEGKFRIGGRFIGLTGANVRQIERAVAELERIMLKRNWRS